MSNQDKLENLFRYLKLLTGAYFENDPLSVRKNVERVKHLIELELNEKYEGGKAE